MKRVKFTSIITALIIGITVLGAAETSNAPSVSASYENTAVFHGGKPYATINGETVWLDGEVINTGSCIYVAPQQVLPALGYSLGWKDDIKAVAAVKDGVVSYIITNSPVLWKGPEKYVSKNKTMVYKGVFYIPMDMFEYFTGCQAETDGDIPVVKFRKRDLLTDTYVDNAYRLNAAATAYKGVYISGNFAMERVFITQDSAKSYAAAVNYIASSLPESVNVYNIVLPTAAEFYGPANVYTDQTAGIKTVYANLSERVTPINAVKPLYEHANESIYFRTDHHWTQRGAYYVYKEFAEVSGTEIAPLSSFPVRCGSYTGSFANFAKGTYGESIVRANPDTIERFLAPAYTAGAAYNDMYMKQYAMPLKAVYENTNSYSAFIGGDNPLSVFTSNTGNGKRIVIIKESFGNAFATWALNNYSEVYVIDVRKFNNGGNRFNLKDFYSFVPYDDLVIINYPVSVSSSSIRKNLTNFIDS